MAAKAGRLQIQLEMQVAQLQRDLDKANRAIESSTKKWATDFGNVATVFAGSLLSSAVQTAIGGLTESLTNVMQRYDDIADGAKRVGLSAEAFQELAFAASQSGLEMAELEKSIVRLQKNFGEAGTKFKETINGIKGLNFDDLARMGDKDRFIAVVDALGQIKDNAERAAAGSAIFGKSWSALGPLMAEGREGIEALIAKAHELGIILSDDAVQAGEAFNDQMDVVKLTLEGLASQALAPLLPQLTALSNELLSSGKNASTASPQLNIFAKAANFMAEEILGTIQAFRELGSIWQTTQEILTAPASPTAIVTGQTAAAIEKAVKGDIERTKALRESYDRLRDSIMGARVHLVKAWEDAPTAPTGPTDTGDTADTANTKANTEAKVANTKARKENNEEKQKEIDLDALMAGAQARFEESFKRTSDLLTDREIAQARANGANEDAIEIMRAQAAGYDEKQIKILRDIQALEAQTKAQDEATAATERQQQMLLQTLDAGFNDIFMSMTEGAQEATDAVIRLAAQLLSAFLTAKALQLLGLPSTGGLFQNAKGNVYGPGGLIPFAQGGVVYGATPFTFGGGRGVMGEAGPEGIFPLARDSAGRLGVRGTGGGVNVSVHNYAGASVGVEQRGDDIRVIIDQVRGVLASDVARGGNAFAGALEGAYRLRR